jgi:hypothetical protein
LIMDLDLFLEMFTVNGHTFQRTMLSELSPNTCTVEAEIFFMD